MPTTPWCIKSDPAPGRPRTRNAYRVDNKFPRRTIAFRGVKYRRSQIELSERGRPTFELNGREILRPTLLRSAGLLP